MTVRPCFTLFLYNEWFAGQRRSVEPGCAVFFDIHVLEKRKIRFDDAFAPGSIDFFDDDLKQAGDLRAAGEAELVDPFGSREIHLHGEVRGEMEVVCARCLEPLRVSVSSPLNLFYRPMA